MNVFVTGGSRGIGRAIALRFARDGAKRVAIGYLRNDRAAEETAEELRALGAEPVLVRGNVTSQRVLDEVGALGPLDVLVHNAATGVIRPALETEDKHWDWTVNANARALLQLARVAAPQMPAGSSIVAISSLGAQRVLENYILVGTSKAALESLVRYLAVELAPRHPRQRGLGRRRRDRRARALPEPRGDAGGRQREPGRPARRARRHRRRGRVPLLARRRHDPRPDDDRRRRLLAAGMSEHAEQNRRAWNEIHRRRHETAGHRFGPMPGLLDRLEPLAGRRVLHLQCATGETSARLAELGADLVGVDISEEAVAIAAELAPGARFVAADVHRLPADLQDGTFDVVVTESGVIVWLHDLDAWAAGIAAALRPGGLFVLGEEHPVMACLDDELRWTDNYFDDSLYTESGWGHFELTGPPAVEEKAERFWGLGQIVTAVAHAGLRIEELAEQPGSWRRDDPRVPGSFLLTASKS